MKSKIGIGTANFGSVYGLKKKRISKSQIKKIIEISKKNKIKLIDTSSEYPGSEEILGNYNLSDLNIVTKIKIPTNFNSYNIHLVENIFFSSLKKLKVKKIYALLIQNCDELLKKNGKFFYNFFVKLKKRGIIKKLGFSIYSTKTLEKLDKSFRFDIIQIPLNIIDQRFLKKNFLKKFKKKKIEIHSRSSFLQGLLLMEKKQIPVKFKKYQNIFNKLNNFIEKNNYNKLDYLLKFSLSIKEIDYVILGIESVKQLEQLLLINKNKNFNFKNFNLKVDNKLIDTRLWTKK